MYTAEDTDAYHTKIDKLQQVGAFMDDFTGFITEANWSERFDTSL